MNFEGNDKLKDLARKADEGDIRAIYQMYINYLEGDYTDVNLEVSKQYFDILKEKTFNEKITLKDMKLNDFRGLESLKVRFHRNLTVIIGNNGTGKSTILDALALSLSWLKANILREDGKGSYIKDVDINTKKNVSYSAITTRFIYLKKPFEIMLSKAKEGSTLKRTNDLVSIKILSGIFKHVNEADNSRSLPLLAYYSVSRSTEGSGVDVKKQSSKDKKEWTKFDAYDDVLTNRHDFGEFMKWFIFIDSYSKQNYSSDDLNKISQIKSEIDGLANVVKHINVTEGVSNDLLEPLKRSIWEKQSQLLQLEKNINESPSGFVSKVIKVINLAFNKFLPELNDIRVQYSKSDIKLVLNKNDIIIEAQQLSQGEKSLLTLVGDLVRRLVILNPELENPLEGSGIVLIDEIDLHLHPSWQQKIILNLQSVFPNIQFIVSTHSPQVLSTVLAECIRIIKPIYKGAKVSSLTLVQPPYQTKGVISADILAEIMDTDPKPHVKESIMLDKYKEMIELNDYENDEAKLLWDKLVKHFGEDHPLIFECINLKIVQEMRGRLSYLKSKKEAK